MYLHESELSIYKLFDFTLLRVKIIIPSLFFSLHDERKIQDVAMAINMKDSMVVPVLFITRLFLWFFDRKNLIDLNVFKYLNYTGRPFYLDFINHLIFCKSKMDARVIL